MKVLKDPRYGFATGFDPDTGMNIRSNVYTVRGMDTGRAPFQASFPHLLDIGVMGHCAHGLSGRCLASGVSCYQDGKHVVRPHMELDLFERILRQCRGRVFQVALGGRGDPDEHPRFPELLRLCRDHGVVPNFTTSGFGLTDRHLSVVRESCGAVAVSWYRSEYTLRAIRLFVEAGIRTNIHYVLSTRTIEEAIWRMETGDWPSGINRVIFLLHKPVGLGTQAEVLRAEDERVRRFFGLFSQPDHGRMAGFDSCSVPGLVTMARGIAPQSMETCEAARFSAYISSDGIMTPCSFDGDSVYGVDLGTHSVEEAWNSPAFERFRRSLAGNCPGCGKRDLCMGGCPLKPEIVLCPDRTGDGDQRRDGGHEDPRGFCDQFKQ